MTITDIKHQLRQAEIAKNKCKWNIYVWLQTKVKSPLR